MSWLMVKRGDSRLFTKKCRIRQGTLHNNQNQLNNDFQVGLHWNISYRRYTHIVSLSAKVVFHKLSATAPKTAPKKSQQTMDLKSNPLFAGLLKRESNSSSRLPTQLSVTHCHFRFISTARPKASILLWLNRKLTVTNRNTGKNKKQTFFRINGFIKKLPRNHHWPGQPLFKRAIPS